MTNQGFSKPLIEITDLQKIFQAQGKTVTALDGINLTINEGEIFGIIGMSGAGKSTLVRCMNLLEKPTRGEVRIDGRDIGLLSEKELRILRRSVSMIFQQFNLLMQRTALKNVEFPLRIAGVKSKEAKEKAVALLRLVGLEDRQNDYPSQLSGGQRQRVAIARALATGPRVLLSDEATSALDPLTTRSILELLQKINRELGITIVIITHQMNVIKSICTRVAVMSDAKVVETGLVGAVLQNADNSLTRRLFETFDDEGALEGSRCYSVRYSIDRAGALLAGLTKANGGPVKLYLADVESDSGFRIEIPDDEQAVFRMRSYLEELEIAYEEVGVRVGF